MGRSCEQGIVHNNCKVMQLIGRASDSRDLLTVPGLDIHSYWMLCYLAVVSL